MASRRKKAPADLRTVDLFTGLTKLEEAERAVNEEAPTVREPRSYESEKDDAASTAVRWLGMDVFEDGDDVMLALGKRGAVLCLVTAKPGSVPRSSVQVRLSPKQLTKLKKLLGEM